MQDALRVSSSPTPRTLDSVLTPLRQLEGVYDAYRRSPGGRRPSDDSPVAGDAPFRAPTGTHDVLAPESARWEALVARFADARRARRLTGWSSRPMFEDAGVFRRGVGEESEVVTRRCTSSRTRAAGMLALRPEGTASVVRAFVQHRPPVPWKAGT